MDKNQGYSILKAVMLENGRGFALGHHPTAPSPYVTWACYDDEKGQRQYEWGHYGNDLNAMEKDFAGRVQDYQVRDITNMGAAMAPAAAATLLRYLRDTGTPPAAFDCIYTGDLGRVGSALLAELLEAEGVGPLHHEDCGCLLYGRDPKVHSGASGPGCCASVLCGHILPQLEQGKLGRVLFIATGALMSQTTFLQKESIPAVAHLVELASPAWKEGSA